MVRAFGNLVCKLRVTVSIVHVSQPIMEIFVQHQGFSKSLSNILNLLIEFLCSLKRGCVFQSRPSIKYILDLFKWAETFKSHSSHILTWPGCSIARKINNLGAPTSLKNTYVLLFLFFRIQPAVVQVCELVR